MKLRNKAMMILMAVVMVFSVSAIPVLADDSGSVQAVYLNGSKGNDANTGETKDTAVKTFGKAKELAEANSEITTIYVTGTVTFSDELSLKGTNAIVKRGETFTGYLFRATGSGAALSDITIDGNSETLSTGSALVQVSGTLNIKDGAVLRNNTVSSGGIPSGGGIYISSGGTVNMTGGRIAGNVATWGGGVYLSGNATFNMSGGIIEENRAVDEKEGSVKASGGGICTWSGSVGENLVKISGDAIIRNNISDERGGGISIGPDMATNGSEILEMTGGRIDGNEAGASGGGIFVQANLSSHKNTATISGGYITNNKMTGTGNGNSAFGGGGIYVNGYPNTFTNFSNGEVYLTNAVITENTAAMEGGGYAGCPVSETEIYLTNGNAFYGNKADGAADLYILSSNNMGNHSGNPSYSIANTMLGGVPCHYKDDNGEEVPLNKLEGTLDANKGEEIRLHTDEVGDENTKALAKVWITGNTSVTRGGGIGSNGTFIGGESDTTSLDVTKEWAEDEESQRPEIITVELYRNTEGSSSEAVCVGFETIKPDDEGKWALTFTNLPAADAAGNLYEYSVREIIVKGYISEVTGSQTEGYKITNTLKPEEPEPGVTDDKEKPDKNPPDAEGTQTGDGTDLLLCILLLVASLTGIMTVYILNRVIKNR